MSLEHYFRGGIHGTIQIRAVLASVALLAAPAARKVAPHFQAALDTHTTIEPAPTTTSDFGLIIAASDGALLPIVTRGGRLWFLLRQQDARLDESARSPKCAGRGTTTLM